MGDLFGTDEPAPAASAAEGALIASYVEAGRTLDDLPYTLEFEALYSAINGEATGRTRREVFHQLHNLRKAKKLPRLGRAASDAPRLTAEEEQLLAELVISRVGSLGQRDQLPYDSRIDDLSEVFNAKAGRSLTQHDVWRVIAKLAK